MSGDWFKFYEDSIHDPKLLKLSDPLYRAWTILLCFASKNGGTLPAANDIATALREKPAKVAEWISKLKLAGLFDYEDGQFVPHNWERRQYKVTDPTAAARMQRYRKRKAGNVTDDSVTTVTTVTALRLEEEVEGKKRKEEEGEDARAPEFSLIDEGFKLTEADIAVAHDAGMTDATLDTERKLFIARKQSDGKQSANWSAEWRVWCERWKAMKPKQAPEAGDPITPDKIDQEKVVRMFAKTGIWSKWAGPEPGQLGCVVPAELFAKHGLLPDGRKIQETQH